MWLLCLGTLWWCAGAIVVKPALNAVNALNSLPPCTGPVSLLQEPVQDAFDKIYTKHLWGGDGVTRSRSGPGSNIGRATETLCSVIFEALLKASKEKEAAGMTEYELNFLDAPSGDFFWMPGCLSRIASRLPAGARLNYQGVDVSDVATGIAEGKRASAQASVPTVTIEPFKTLNLAEAGILGRTFPAKHFDVINCRDALQHNAMELVHAILGNFNLAGTWLVNDVDTAGANGKDIRAGQFRPIDITAPPFNNVPECLQAGPVRRRENEHFGIFKLPLTA
ncbi:unnamed protein product [Symbiodinium natans]|uniref:Uncharacterized protein n=1 Tax=Symbiodinium natans TaxID=878477 RepID=A0A812PN06_9DINO|nr:unnamed protein product [Symbiodinium natans]